MPFHEAITRDPANPFEWIRRARSNLTRAVADRALPGVLLEDLCFDAQQAAEKGLKAILVGYQRAFPRTHSIGDLLDSIEVLGITIPTAVHEADILTVYAVEGRYPGLVEDVSPEEYSIAVNIAQAVVDWASSVVSQGPNERSVGNNQPE